MEEGKTHGADIGESLRGLKISGTDSRLDGKLRLLRRLSGAQWLETLPQNGKAALHTRNMHPKSLLEV